MTTEEIAQAINERLSTGYVPAEELRARAEGDRLFLEGTRAAQIPGARRELHIRNPESFRTPMSVSLEPEDAIRWIDEFMRGWPHS